MAGHEQDHAAASGQDLVLSPPASWRPSGNAAVSGAGSEGFPGWMSLGACRSEDPGLFFPVSSAAAALAQVNSAKAVCARCPVRANCLSYALITGQDEGIWGGTTAAERWPYRQLRRGHRSGPGGSW
jgi:WhiB family redox-sensing transcriptional regulator